jgi:hypothetical protein
MNISVSQWAACCLIVFVSTASHAQAPAPCEEFSLEAMGKSMEKVPVHDQGGTGDCSAYSYSEAIDAWKNSNEPDKAIFPTSPHAFAISEHDMADRQTKGFVVNQLALNPLQPALNFGRGVSQSFQVFKKVGTCDYNQFGANFVDSKTGISMDNPFWLDLQKQYGDLHDAFYDALVAGDKIAQDNIVNQGQVKLSATVCLGGLAKNPFNDIDFVRSFIVQKDVFSSLKKMSDKICEGHTAPLPEDFPEPVSFDLSDVQVHKMPERAMILSRVIDSMFNFKNRQPIMAGICGQVIQNPTNIGVDPMYGMTNPSVCTGHGVLIIGRKKMADGQCGYIIRNSWGADQDSVSNREHINDRGDIVVAQGMLLNNLMLVGVLPPKNEKYTAPQFPPLAPLQPTAFGRPINGLQPGPTSPVGSDQP